MFQPGHFPDIPNSRKETLTIPPPTLDYSPGLRRRASGYAWLVVALLFVVAVLNYLDRLMITAMVAPIRDEFHISNSKVGLFTSVFLWVYAVVSPVGGFLADRFGRKGVIVASLFFWSLATCLSGFAHTFHELLFARALMGISEACYMPAALAIIADYHRGPTRSLATGVHMAGIYTGAALGGLGGYMAEHFGWRLGFRAFGTFGIGYGLLLALTLRDRSEPEDDADNSGRAGTARHELQSAGSAGSARPSFVFASSPERTESRFADAMTALVASPGFRVLFAVNVLVGIINWSLYGWLPAYLKGHFNLSLGAAGFTATAYIQYASFLGVLLAGLWADRWIRSNRRARALVPAIGFCVAGPCLMLVGTTSWLPGVIAALIVVGLGRGSFDANHMPALRELVNQRYSATGFGLLNFISTATGGLMVYAGGALQDANANHLGHLFQGCGIAMCVAGVLLLGVRFPRREVHTINADRVSM
jgi:MFS family permease